MNREHSIGGDTWWHIDAELLLELAAPSDEAFSVALTMRRDYYNLLSAPECRPLYDRLEAGDRGARYTPSGG